MRRESKRQKNRSFHIFFIYFLFLFLVLPRVASEGLPIAALECYKSASKVCFSSEGQEGIAQTAVAAGETPLTMRAADWRLRTKRIGLRRENRQASNPFHEHRVRCSEVSQGNCQNISIATCYFTWLSPICLARCSLARSSPSCISSSSSKSSFSLPSPFSSSLHSSSLSLK